MDVFVSDEASTDMHYVDLSRNPERYTGYKGNSPQKVWQCIYLENCFKYVEKNECDGETPPSYSILAPLRDMGVAAAWAASRHGRIYNLTDSSRLERALSCIFRLGWEIQTSVSLKSG